MDTIDHHLARFYDRGRFPKEWSLAKGALILYFPLGLLLATLRVTLIVLLATLCRLLPRKWKGLKRWLFLCTPLLSGFVYRQDGGHHLEGFSGIMACNHLSLLDAPALLRLPDTTVLANDEGNGFRRLTDELVESFVMEGSAAGRRQVRGRLTEALEHGQIKRLLAFPEGVVNNGRGLHVFQKFVFSLDQPVLPVCIRIHKPFPVNLHPLHGSHGFNFFWGYFQPWLVFELTFLPPVTRGEDERPEAFAGRVAEMIARQLQIPATRFHARDKRRMKALTR